MSKIVGPETMPRDKTIDAILEKLEKFNDLAMQPWDKLIIAFRNSSNQQKLYAEAILRYEGYGLRVNKNFNKDELIQFDDEELCRMAEMEHGRWNLERIQQGWKKGEKKDVDRKITPYLVPWNELTDEVKTWDLNYVRNWPSDFSEVDIEIYKV